MDAQLRELEEQWKLRQQFEDLLSYFSALLRTDQITDSIELLNQLAPNIKSQLLNFLTEPVWRSLVNKYYILTGTLHGFLFLPSGLLEEAEVLLQITDIENWQDELTANKIDFSGFYYLWPPKANYSNSYFYHFNDATLRDDATTHIGNHYIEITLNSGSTNYWIGSSLWLNRGSELSRDIELMVDDADDGLSGLYTFEYIKGARVYILEVLPISTS